MKKRDILIGTLMSAFIMTGCTDLQEKILNEQDGSGVVSDSKNAQMLIAPSYAYLRDLQSRSGVWLVLESVTDEMLFPTRGTDWNNSNYRTLFTHEYDSRNTYIRNAWNSFMLGITKCNTSLQYLSKLQQNDEVRGYMNEALFIRALCMYHLMDCFGKFPMREYSEMDYSTQPKIYTRSEAIARIESDLNSIIPQLKDKNDIPYGRITKAAAQMLLAKLYLNNQVYTGTAPAFVDGTGKWDETIELCDAIINSGKYILADDYWKLYQAFNENYSNQTETILPIIFNMTAGLNGIDWLNITLHYNQTFGTFKGMWNGCCTTPDFLNSWDTTDPRFQDDRLKDQIGFNLGILVGQQYDVNGNKLKTRTGEDLIYTPEFSVQNSTEEQGARVVKYAPDPQSTYGNKSENDFQYYRLTDVYLMRAEAKYRKGAISEALSDINIIREKRNVRAYTLEDFSLEKIYNERGYEFYWDGPSRRNDMVRFNKYCEARFEKPASEPYKILLPIPLSAMEANPELTQNSDRYE
ncbi:MAG: RagB/SusD family nutrient uptake outer membrane protein [Bacteroidales bacterium]